MLALSVVLGIGVVCCPLSLALSIILGTGTGFVVMLVLLGRWCWRFVIMGPGIFVPPHEQLLMGLGLGPGGESSIVAVSVCHCGRKEKTTYTIEKKVSSKRMK